MFCIAFDPRCSSGFHRTGTLSTTVGGLIVWSACLLCML